MASHDQVGTWDKTSEDIFKSQYPLHRVCRDGDLETLSLLLENSAELNFYEEDGLFGWTPTHWAAYFGKLACLRKIITLLPMTRRDKCDIATYRFRQTPLHLASFGGHPECIQRLLQSGADINFQDYMGETSVHKAARSGSMECANLLISQRANLGLKNYHGLTPAEIATNSDHEQCGILLKQAAQKQVQCGRMSTPSPDLSFFPVSIPAPDHPLADVIEGINGGVIPSPINHVEASTPLISASHSTAANCSTETNQNDCDMETSDSDVFVEDNATRYGLPGIVKVGRKRCLEDLEENGFKRIRFGELDSSLCAADPLNNNVVSSYNAILSLSTDRLRLAAGSSLDIGRGINPRQQLFV